MQPAAAAASLAAHYPRIYFACHRRHVRDPKTRAALSAHQASVLDHLDSVTPTTVSGLARHMGVTASTMSLTLDRLQAAGYVRRVADRADARRVGVVVTAAGDRIKKANSVLDPALVERLMGMLPDEQRRRAIEGLALLAHAADRMNAEKPAPQAPRGRGKGRDSGSHEHHSEVRAAARGGK